jgi:hypothetical protein
MKPLIGLFLAFLLLAVGCYQKDESQISGVWQREDGATYEFLKNHDGKYTPGSLKTVGDLIPLTFKWALRTDGSIHMVFDRNAVGNAVRPEIVFIMKGGCLATDTQLGEVRLVRIR